MKPKSIRQTCTESVGKYIMAYNETKKLYDEIERIEMENWQMKMHNEIINYNKNPNMNQNKTLVPIDLSTIKEINHPVKKIIKIKSKTPIEDIEGLTLVHYDGEVYFYEGQYWGEITGKLYDLLMSNTVQNSISFERREMSYKDTDTNVKYSYKWQDIDITCNACGEKSKISELESWEDDDFYMDNICPKCKESECVSLKYQKMTDYEIDKLLNK